MPKTWEHFPNAPIVEAIVDARIEPAANASWTHQPDDFPELMADYPTTELIIAGLFQAHWSSDAPPAHELQREIIGLRFRSEKEVVQLRVDGFTFSMLPEYSNWNDLLN